LKILKPVRVAGKDYYPPAEADFEGELGERLVEQGFAEKVAGENKSAPTDTGFESVGDISEVLPTVGGEGEQYAIDDLVGIPVVLDNVSFDKGRSGKLEGKDIATVQVRKQDGSRGWFTTWSGPMIAQLKQLVELNALPRKCRIEERQGGSGYRYYILTSARAQAREKQ
jgi:hypothetical protein